MASGPGRERTCPVGAEWTWPVAPVNWVLIPGRQFGCGPWGGSRPRSRSRCATDSGWSGSGPSSPCFPSRPCVPQASRRGLWDRVDFSPVPLARSRRPKKGNCKSSQYPPAIRRRAGAKSLPRMLPNRNPTAAEYARAPKRVSPLLLRVTGNPGAGQPGPRRRNLHIGPSFLQGTVQQCGPVTHSKRQVCNELVHMQEGRRPTTCL
jgi:hypothetical protein